MSAEKRLRNKIKKHIKSTGYSKYGVSSCAAKNVDELSFTSRDSKGLICWWDVTLPKTNYWSVHNQLGRAYALEFLDLISNDKKTEDVSMGTFGYIASEITRQNHNVTDGLYRGFFDTISEYLMTGSVDR